MGPLLFVRWPGAAATAGHGRRNIETSKWERRWRKADDGVTDLYGVIDKPFDFNASRKYPVIEYVYPGPQVEQVTKAFSPKSPNVPLAQLGFVVVEVGNRGGSPQRDKWYDTYGYGNLRDNGLGRKERRWSRCAATDP